MKKCLLAIGFALLVVSGCPNDKEKKHSEGEQELSNAEKKQDRAKATASENKSDAERPTTKIELTEEKLKEVKGLINKLDQKQSKLESALTKLKEKIHKNVSDIQAERTPNGSNEFSEAIKNKRVQVRLKTIQKAHAYQKITEAEIELTALASTELSGMADDFEIDAIVLAGMGEERIDDLLTQLDVVITKIQPRANELVISDKDVSLEPLEKVYDDYIQKEAREHEQKKLKQKREEEGHKREELKKQETQKAEEEKAQMDKFARLIDFDPTIEITLSIEDRWLDTPKWHPQKYLLATECDTNYQKAVCIWDIVSNTRREIKSSTAGHTQDIAWNQISNNNLAILFGDHRSELHIYDITTDTTRIIGSDKISMVSGGTIELFYERYILLCASSRSCKLFDTQNEKIIPATTDAVTFFLHNSRPSYLTIMGTAKEDQYVAIFDVQTGKEEQKRFYECPFADREYGDDWIDNRKKLCQPHAFTAITSSISAEYFATQNEKSQISVFATNKPKPVITTDDPHLRRYQLGRILAGGKVLSFQGGVFETSIIFTVLEENPHSCEEEVSDDDNVNYADTARTSAKFPYTIAYNRWNGRINFKYIEKDGSCSDADRDKIKELGGNSGQFEWSSDGKYFAIPHGEYIKIWKMY